MQFQMADMEESDICLYRTRLAFDRTGQICTILHWSNLIPVGDAVIMPLALLASVFIKIANKQPLLLLKTSDRLAKCELPWPASSCVSRLLTSHIMSTTYTN